MNTGNFSRENTFRIDPAYRFVYRWSTSRKAYVFLCSFMELGISGNASDAEIKRRATDFVKNWMRS